MRVKNHEEISNTNKELVYSYAVANKEVTIAQFMKALNLSKSQVHYAVRYLEANNYLKKEIKQGYHGKTSCYTATMRKYVKPEKVKPVRVAQKVAVELTPEAKAIVKVYKLLDRVPHKNPKPKQHRVTVNMQSGLQAFGDW